VAPEHYDGVITFKSDIYSLGVIFAELLTGQKGHSPVQNVRTIYNETLHGNNFVTLFGYK